MIAWSVCPVAAQAPAPPRDVVPDPDLVRPPAASPALPPSAEPLPAPARQKRFGDWSTVRHEASGQLVCFALGQSRELAGRGAAARTPESAGNTTANSLIYVTSWPQAGIKAEVSVRAGSGFRAGTPVRLTIGAQSFGLSNHGDRAFVGNPTDELKLLEAMKRGSAVTIEGETDTSVATSEQVSLNGLAAALTHVTQGCP